jgi:hypothetical protein
MRRPSSVGSVILVMLRTMFIPLVVYLISFNFSSLMLGVKFIRRVFMWLRFFIWSRKLSVSLYMLLHSTKDKAGHRFSS